MTPTDGATEYTTCEGLLTQSSSTWPKTSVFEIVASGVSANKLVIGKPGTAADVTNGGFIDPATLATCVQQAVAAGWNAGVMAFQVNSFALFVWSKTIDTSPRTVPSRRHHLDYYRQGQLLPVRLH